MSRVKIGDRAESGSWKKSAALLACVCAVLLAQQGARALPQPTDALKFFNNFFVTGHYVVGGVGLWNTGSGTINMSSPPAPMTAAPDGADVLAAFLVWQVVTSLDPNTVNVNAGATFNGLPLVTPLESQLVVSLGGTQACLLSGGFGGAGNKVYTFRADVLRFLDEDATGRRVINKAGGYPVALPNSGSSLRTLGASLVVIYRHPDPTTPLSAIVMYDGTFVKQQSDTLQQRIEGFYDPANVSGKITYIAGSAQSGLGERLSGPFTTVNDPFSGALGNAWDNVTKTTNPLVAGASFFDTSIAPRYSGLSSIFNDCITAGAIIYETPVNDTDGDGLLNRWEQNSASDAAPLRDPNGQLLPYLKDMGADPAHRDMFIEIAAMKAPAGTTYGSEDAPLRETLHSVTDPLGHNHLPTPAVLKLVGDAFQAAPVDARYPSAGPGIAMHVDVGRPSAYKALLAYATQPPGDSPYNSNVADAYIIGTGAVGQANESLARGGEAIPETACVPGPHVDCQFPAYAGTVSWKTGFQAYKEALFDASRKDSFRFGLYAHAKATPKSVLPCLGVLGQEAGFNEMGVCASGAPNPLIHVPAGVSGSADYPGGGDFLITLGLWDNTNFVGSDIGGASTMMHEMGHTFGLGHGGDPLPNCKPNYVSVMNYLFQLGGLVDGDGNPHLGYSDYVNPDLVETSLSEAYSFAGSYRTSWYAPQLPGDSRTPAKRFCNGLSFDPASPPPATVRIDGTVPSPATDWNADGDTADSGLSQDINFDGVHDAVPGGPTTTLTGYDDWAHLRLNQIGSRPNFGGFSVGPLESTLLTDGSKLLADGSKLLADGSVLLADGSVLLADGSKLLSDGAKLLADGSVLLADGSRLLADGSKLLADGSVLLADGARILADGSVLLADGSVLLADGAVFLADGSVLLGDGVRFLADGSVLLADGSRLLADGAPFAWHIPEPTPQSAAESGITPGPTALNAEVTSDAAPALNHRIRLSWKAPALGNVFLYRVLRVQGDGPVPQDAEPAFTVPGSQTSGVDLVELPNGNFTYVVDAVLDDAEGPRTPRSNEKTILAINNPPVANNQGPIVVYEDSPSGVITLTFSDPDSAGVQAVSTAPPANGGLTGALPNVTYLSALNYNGPDSFTFKVRETTTWNGQNQESAPGTVSITVTPVNDKPGFAIGPNQTVTQPAGAQTVGLTISFDAGPLSLIAPPGVRETQGILEFLVSNTNNALFSSQPAIAPNGTLTYTPAAGASGVATVKVRVRDNGGTAEGHGAVDISDEKTFTITVNPPPATPITFQRTDLWMTTSSANRTFDLKAEVLKNGVPVLEKIVANTTLGYGTSFSKAIYEQIGAFPTTAVGFTATDTLSVRVSMKVSNSCPGGNNASGAIRLWYNIPVPPPANDSHLHASRNGTDVRYYLVAPFKLQKDGSVSGPTQSIDAVVYKTGYTVLGTWSTTSP